MTQHALTDVADISGAVLEVFVFELGKLLDEFLNGPFERGLGAEVLGTNQLLDARYEAVILQHELLRVDDGGVNLGNGGADAFFGASQLVDRPGDGAVQPTEFALQRVATLGRQTVEAHVLGEPMRAADAKAR